MVRTTKNKATWLAALAMTVVLVFGQIPSAAIAEVMGAAADASAQTEVVTPAEGESEPGVEEDASSDEGTVEAPSTDGEKNNDATTTPEESGTTDEPAASDKATTDDVAAAGEKADSVEGTTGDGATSKDDAEASEDSIEPYALRSLTGQRWVSNQKIPSSDRFTFQISSDKDGINTSDGLPVSALAEPTISSGSNTYSFWKVSLKGKDGWRGQDYGTKQTTEGGSDETATGTAVTRIRYQNNQFQLMIGGNWVTMSSNGTDRTENDRENTLQLVFYYLQDKQVGDYADFHMAQWYDSNYSSSGWNWAPKAIIAEVVDADTEEQYAQSETMYYYYNHDGVNPITVTERDLSGFEIVGVEKYRAADQRDAAWTSVKKDGDPMATYDINDVMSTSWNSDGNQSTSEKPNHVIFTIKVRRTAQVSLVKQLADVASSKYANSMFEFTAQVTLPEGSTSVLRSEYPAVGLAEGSTVSGVVSQDGKSVSLSGIRVKPGQKATIEGLPNGAAVKFTEVGVIENGQLNKDPSLFETSYANDKDASKKDGSAVAKPEPRTGENDERQTVTTTNKQSEDNGKLTVSKTFTNIKELTYQERMNLRDSFRIESTNNQVPALTTKNADSVTPDGGLTDTNANEVTYTWTLNHLKPGSATLTETNYQVGEYVSTSTKVNTNGATVGGSVTTDIDTGKTNSVTFTNQYKVSPISINITKAWAENVPTAKRTDSVTVQLIGKVKDNNVVSTRDVVLSEDGNWTTKVTGLPQRLAGTSDDISYSVIETKVGDSLLENSGFTAKVTGDAAKGFTVTNSLATGSLTLSKTVDGDAANTTEHFTFNLVADDSVNGDFTASFTGTEGDEAGFVHETSVTFTDGKATVQLKHGESVTINDLPAGDVTVTEKVEGKKVTKTMAGTADVTSRDGKVTQGHTVQVPAGDNAAVSFTNTTNHAPSLGISSNIAPLLGLLATAGIGGTALALTHRPRGKHARHGSWKE